MNWINRIYGIWTIRVPVVLFLQDFMNWINRMFGCRNYPGSGCKISTESHEWNYRMFSNWTIRVPVVKFSRGLMKGISRTFGNWTIRVPVLLFLQDLMNWINRMSSILIAGIQPDITFRNMSVRIFFFLPDMRIPTGYTVSYPQSRKCVNQANTRLDSNTNMTLNKRLTGYPVAGRV